MGGEGESGNDSPSLWYKLNGTGKGVHASVCRAPTDFQARISIYKSSNDSDGSSGGCDDDDDNNNNNLSCVAGTKGANDGAPIDAGNSIVDTENDESLNQACLKCAKERSMMVDDATSKG